MRASIGIFGSNDAAAAKAIAATLTKQAKGGFEGFHNDAKVTCTLLSRGDRKVTVEGGCAAFHEYACGLFNGSASKTQHK